MWSLDEASWHVESLGRETRWMERNGGDIGRCEERRLDSLLNVSACSQLQHWIVDEEIPCRLAYSSRLLLILCVHPGSALGSSTVTITTGGPLPTATFGIFAAVHAFVPLLPPVLLVNHKNPRTPSMTKTTRRNLSLRMRFLSAGGIAIEAWFLAAYGGGRDVFRGGIAKCIVRISRNRGQGGGPLCAE
jgi:hypothetical protein